MKCTFYFHFFFCIRIVGGLFIDVEAEFCFLFLGICIWSTIGSGLEKLMMND